jgi:hypothetical protein
MPLKVNKRILNTDKLGVSPSCIVSHEIMHKVIYDTVEEDPITATEKLDDLELWLVRNGKIDIASILRGNIDSFWER